MQSLWHLTAPQSTSDAFPEGPQDVVIAGAGLTGIATAVLLSRTGMSVTVLERNILGGGTTGGTMAKLSLLQGTRYSAVEKHTDWATLWAYAEANREGQAWLIHQMGKWGMPIEWETSWAYAAQADQRDILERELSALRSVNLPADLTDDVGVPWETHGGIRMDRQVALQPILVLNALADELRSRGGRIVEHCAVTGIEADKDWVTVNCDGKSIEAAYAVVATGQPVINSHQYRPKLGSFTTYVAAYEVPEETLPSGMYIAVGPPSHSVRVAMGPTGRPVIVASGGHNSTTADGSAPTPELDAWVQKHFATASENTRQITWWEAGDYWTKTQVPFAGFVPDGKGRVLAATGYDGWGMSNSIAAALTLSADILGGHLWWAEELRRHVTIFDQDS